jgi:hypothetical protein
MAIIFRTFNNLSFIPLILFNFLLAHTLGLRRLRWLIVFYFTN